MMSGPWAALKADETDHMRHTGAVTPPLRRTCIEHIFDTWVNDCSAVPLHTTRTRQDDL